MKHQQMFIRKTIKLGLPLVLLFMISLLLCLSARAEFVKNKIAVLDFALQGQAVETQDLGAIVAEWFITALVRDGRFDVVERALLKKIIEEQKLSLSGIIDDSSASELGRILGVKAIITGSVLHLQDILEVNARIIDVQTGSIVAAENVKSRSSASLQTLIEQMTKKIIRNFPLEGYIVKRSDKKVIIDLGRDAGVQLDMEFVVFKEGAIIKHPKSGKILDVELIETGKIKIIQVHGTLSNGRVSEEKSPGAIEYGHQVKSISGPLQPPVAAPLRAAPPSSPKRVVTPQSKKQQHVAAGPVHPLAKKLRSATPRDMKYVSKKVIRNGINNPSVLNAMEKILLKGYKVKQDNRHHVDAMAWICRALGDVGGRKYKATLEKVASEAGSRKLSKYAAKALKNM